MNMKMLRKGLTVLAAALALASVTAAQDVMPLPAAPGQSTVGTRNSTLYSPVYGDRLEPIVSGSGLFAPPQINSALEWVYLWSTEQVVKVKLVATGEVLTYRDGINCTIGNFYNGCDLDLAATGFFDLVKDEQEIKWRVMATMAGGEVYKSEWATAIVDEVVTPVLQIGYSGEWMYEGLHKLTWINTIVNEVYTLIIKNADTGELVQKFKVGGLNCTNVCEIDPFIFPGIVDGGAYSWLVKAKGHTGETAKSAKNVFRADRM